MAPNKKSKGFGVSTASFFDLNAEISRQKEEVAKNKTAGKLGRSVRPDKKPTIWARQNKGVAGRAAHDVELEEVSKPTLESARATLERKAKIYDKLRKGKTGGLNDKQIDTLLVDFDSKTAGDTYDSDSDDVDESLVVPKAPGFEDEDPIVEYEDEFGRIRTAKRSEVPRELASNNEPQPDEDEDIIIRNPSNHFPVYEPSEERIAEIADAHSEMNNPLNVHYDASHEVRSKGAGFYQFSGDEETRRLQMEELKSARTETEKTRLETGAVDVKFGEMDGMQNTEVSKLKSRAMEKRKREIEERRKIVEAKRRKVQGGPQTNGIMDDGHDQTVVSAPSGESAPADPFAALEGQTKTDEKGKGKAKANPADDSADAFLTQLERELLSGEAKRSFQ